MRFSDLVQKPMSFFNYSLFKSQCGRSLFVRSSVVQFPARQQALTSRLRRETTIQKVAAIRNSSAENCNYWKYYRVSRKVPDRIQELAWPVSVGSNHYLSRRARLNIERKIVIWFAVDRSGKFLNSIRNCTMQCSNVVRCNCFRSKVA